MNRQQMARYACVALVVATASAAGATTGSDAANTLSAADKTGTVRTFSTSDSIDTNNPFFQSLGSNGRSCASCHRPETAWSITPAGVQARFKESAGTDPLFRTNDGSNSPNADVSTDDARRHAYSMLLGKALIRVGLPIPAGAEFTLAGADDPYGFAGANELSLFRRPLPSTNLRFLTGVMWDGRETHGLFKPPMDAGGAMSDLVASFKGQAASAVRDHAQGTVTPTDTQLQQIVTFELGLTTAQQSDVIAGVLSDGDALGGPRMLANMQFHLGINDALGADPTQAPFEMGSMTLFDAWTPQHGQAGGSPRAAIARGEELFNYKEIAITGVGGLNDELQLPVIAGTCTTCHDAPNVGNHSVALAINIGVSDASRRTPDMPLYTLRNNASGATLQSTDPGRALITGKWNDMGKFKPPVLRGLAARAPYFHNGMAASIEDVLNFYVTRFNIGLTPQERSDLIAFLNAL